MGAWAKSGRDGSKVPDWSVLPSRPCHYFVGSTLHTLHPTGLRKTINLLSNSKLLALLLLLWNGSAGNKTLENSDKFYSFVMSGVRQTVEAGGPEATSEHEKVPLIIRITEGGFRGNIFLEFDN